MKKRNFVVSLVLLALFAIPMVANAYSTRDGYYFSSSATKGSGYTTSTVRGSSGVKYVYASVRYGGTIGKESGGTRYASATLYYNPYYGTWGGYNGAADTSGWVYVSH